jgi:hypothetical protein
MGAELRGTGRAKGPPGRAPRKEKRSPFSTCSPGASVRSLRRWLPVLPGRHEKRLKGGWIGCWTPGVWMTYSGQARTDTSCRPCKEGDSQKATPKGLHGLNPLQYHSACFIQKHQHTIFWNEDQLQHTVSFRLFLPSPAGLPWCRCRDLLTEHALHWVLKVMPDGPCPFRGWPSGSRRQAVSDLESHANRMNVSRRAGGCGFRGALAAALFK